MGASSFRRQLLPTSRLLANERSHFLMPTIQEVAAQEGYDLVVDRASGAVVFWKPDNDLTQKVLDLLSQTDLEVIRL